MKRPNQEIMDEICQEERESASKHRYLATLEGPL